MLMPPENVQAQLDAWAQRRAEIRATRTKLGVVGYAHLLAMLTWYPSTVLALAQRARMGHLAAYRWVMAMHQLGRVHVASWLELPRRPLLPVFAVGPGPDAPPPSERANGRPVERCVLPMRRLTKELIAFEHLLRALEVQATRAEVVEATGLDDTTARDGLRALHRLQLAHVAGWYIRPQGGALLAIYLLGPGRDAPQRRQKPTARDRSFRQRQRELRGVKPLEQAFHLMAATAAAEQHAGGAL